MTPKLTAIAATIALVFASGQLRANGTDPTVITGQASFSTQGSILNITNNPGTVIDWQGFSIGASETTRFIQQSAASNVLNRVVGPDPSVIFGTLTSNGRVFLINPSGILFGQGARVDVAGLVASTLNLSNQDFLAGRLNFAPNPLAGKVVNQGTIITPSGGSVYLVAPNVANSGIINSPQGDVILAAGQSVKIFDTSTPGVRVEITAGDNTAVNVGKILAQSGQVGIYGAALRNAGIINADQVVRDASGKLVLRAKRDVTLEAGSRLSASGEQGGQITVQSETGTTQVSGTIEARNTGPSGKGGTVQLLGNRVDLTAAGVDASGMAGGGTVLVGGNFHGAGPEQNALATTIGANSSINADAINTGNGGRIAVWSDGDTSVAGILTARGGSNSGDGGFIETSGHNLSIAESARLNTLATQGKTGTWLIDPQDFTIAASGGDITGTALSSDLGTTDVEVQSSGGGSSGSGNVNVNDTVSWSANNVLTLTASNDVNINANVTATGNTAGLVINPNTANGVDPASGMGVFNLNGASVTLSGTNPSLAIAGATYTVINDLGAPGSTTSADLQGMNGGLATNYALGSDIDATATSAWNAGTGFTPIGSLATPFTGTFDGLGHTVSSLTINLTTPDVGLFGVTGSGAVIRNVGLVGGSVTGLAGTGALVGNNGPGTSISNSYATASVSGAAGTGGLVGSNTTGAISNSYATGNVVGAAGTGGLVGSSTTGAISTSYATGDVSGAAGTGGLVGSNTSGSIGTSFATGSVSGAAGTGGLIGGNTSGAISSSYATGNVDGGTGAGVGGLIGSNTSGTVMNSYAAGGVSGTGASRGALIGSSNANVVSNSFWDKTTSIVQISAGGGLGMTTADMQTQANFTSASLANGGGDPGWDFTNTWLMYDGQTYPLLQSFMTPLSVTANSDTKTYNGIAYSGGNGVTYSGLVNSIAPAGALSYSGTSQGAINANSYVITPAGLQSDQHYLITFIDGTLTVTPKAVTISGTVADDKVYDGDTRATLSNIGTVATGVGSETLTLNGPLAANINFNSKDVLVADTVTGTGYSIADGTGLASNYALTSTTATAAASITARGITGSITAANKDYDANNSATILTLTLSGVIIGDTVSYSGGTALFSDKNVATGKTVTGSGLRLIGVDAGNYTVNSSATTTADITALGITGSITAANKVYDATHVATITERTLSGVLGTDVVSYSGGAASFDTKNVGTGKTVTGTGLTLSGADAGNYTVNSTATTTADITPAALAINAVTDSRVYNGTTSSAGVVTYSGLRTGDTLTGLSQAYASKNVMGALGSTLNVNGGYTLTDGNAGGNYSITTNSAVGTITALSITGSITAANKVYDATDVATITGRTLSGVLSTDVVSYSGGTATFSDKNAAAGKTVTGTGLSLIGADPACKRATHSLT